MDRQIWQIPAPRPVRCQSASAVHRWQENFRMGSPSAWLHPRCPMIPTPLEPPKSVLHAIPSFPKRQETFSLRRRSGALDPGTHHLGLPRSHHRHPTTQFGGSGVSEMIGDFPMAERFRRVRRLDGLTFEISFLTAQLAEAEWERFVPILRSTSCMISLEKTRTDPGAPVSHPWVFHYAARSGQKINSV